MKKKSQMSLVPLLCLWLPVLASRKRLNSREEGLKEKKEKERRREGRKEERKKERKENEEVHKDIVSWPVSVPGWASAALP